MSLKLFSNTSYRQRMFSLPIMFMLGAACLLGSFSWQMARQQTYSAGVNLAGRQRMLNQRHAREVLERSCGDKTDYQATRRLLLDSLMFLREGGTHKFGKVPPAKDPRLVEALNQQEQDLRATFTAADQYLDAVVWNGTESEAGNGSSESRAQLMAATAKAHSSAHETVQVISKVSTETSVRGSYFIYGMGLVVTLICGWWSLYMCNSASKVFRSKAQIFSDLSKKKLHSISTELRQNAIDTADKANMASDAAEQVSSNATSLSNAVEQFEDSIKEIASNASGAASVARNAVDATERTNQTVSRLGESSNEIGNVIKVINSIAEQTNLLALNATIEAARAGDAGKGFAVVANEVKELAKETSKATEDIIHRIEAIQTDTVEAVDAIGQVSRIIGEINETQNAIAGAVEQQSAMTSEISRNVSEVAFSSGEIAKNISTVADTAKSTTTGSEQTLATADNMEQMAAELLAFVGETKELIHTPHREIEIEAKSTDAAQPATKGKYQLD